MKASTGAAGRPSPEAGRIAAKLTGQGFHQAAHSFQLARQLGLLPAGLSFLLVEGLALVGGAAAERLHFGLQGSPLLDPVRLLPPHSFHQRRDLRVRRRVFPRGGHVFHQRRQPRELALHVLAKVFDQFGRAPQLVAARGQRSVAGRLPPVVLLQAFVPGEKLQRKRLELIENSSKKLVALVLRRTDFVQRGVLSIHAFGL